MKDYTGLICGCWEVLERDYHPTSKSHETFWLCKCKNCNNISSVRKSTLDKKPLTCNYCKNQHPNIKCSYNIGDRYGLLTIIGKCPSNKKHTYVQCQCECGNIINVRLEHLKGQNHSKTISCGCYKKSAGELKIEKILNDNNIIFQEQYIIPELSYFMKFDFAIFDTNNKLIKLIEYDGEQHFQPIKYFGGEEKLKIQQERDKRKNQYCKEHHINLLRIPYYNYDKIDLNYLLSSLENEN